MSNGIQIAVTIVKGSTPPYFTSELASANFELFVGED